MAIKSILFIFGTRPEAIKLAPVIHELRNDPENFKVTICITAQHREMLDQVLSFFEIKPDFDMNIMQPNQDLFSLSAAILTGLKPILDEVKPDFVFVHGDTSTTLFASLACFYAKIKIGHIEAGLRTFDKFSPFPEEINRTLTTQLADFHFAPTEMAKTNLINEHVKNSKLLVTGNTVIDALIYTMSKIGGVENIEDIIPGIKEDSVKGKRIILVTGHRRENHGVAFNNICSALKQIVEAFDDVCVIFPVHPNPNVKQVVFDKLGGIKYIFLIEPLIYQQFVWLMNRSYLILTDSGGIQEEAPTLKKPVFVMRDSTERPEALELGFIKLVGTNQDLILNEIALVLSDSEAYRKMEASYNPYGDGKASERIAAFLLNNL